MNLEQARTLLEKSLNIKISNKELASALGMQESNISRKLASKTRLKQRQINALQDFYAFELPCDIHDEDLTGKACNYDLLEKVIIELEKFLQSNKYSLRPDEKAKLTVSIYRMSEFNNLDLSDDLIENLIRLMQN